MSTSHCSIKIEQFGPKLFALGPDCISETSVQRNLQGQSSSFASLHFASARGRARLACEREHAARLAGSKAEPHRPAARGPGQNLGNYRDGHALSGSQNGSVLPQVDLGPPGPARPLLRSLLRRSGPRTRRPKRGPGHPPAHRPVRTRSLRSKPH